MNVESFREFCLAKKATTDSFPFNESVMVFKVMNKMFALTDLNDDFKISLKCDPIKAVELKDTYEFILPARHFNKKHWITVSVADSVSNDFIKDLISHSYDLVISGLSKKDKEKLIKL